MESKQSGLVTPPIVSPRPVQNNKSTSQQPLTADESWKVVGSPPRRPLLSPPDERERGREREREREREEELSKSLEDTIPTNMDGKTFAFEGLASTTTITNRTATTTDSSVSSSSPKSSPPTPSTLYSLSNHFRRSKGEETLTKGSLDGSPSPDNGPMPPFHFKSASTGTHTDNHRLSVGTNSFLFDTPSSPTTKHSRHPGYESLSESSTFLLQGTPLSHNYSLDRMTGSQRIDDSEKTGAHDLMRLNQFLWDDDAPQANVEGSSNYQVNASKYPPPLDTSPTRLSDPIFPGTTFRNGRSLSFSEPSFPSVLEGEGSSTSRSGLAKSTFPTDDDPLMDMRTYRSSLLPTMEEETEDSTEHRMSRARSFSTSATFGLSPFVLSSPGFTGSNTAFGPTQTDVFANSTNFMSGMNQSSGSGSVSAAGSVNNCIHPNNNNNNINNNNHSNTNANNNGSSRPFLQRKLSGGLPAWSSPSSTLDQTSNHRRSLTSNASYSAPIWEMPSLFQPLQSPVEQDRMDRHRVARRFSLAPSMSSSSMHQYDNSLDSTNGLPGFGSNSPGVNSFQRHPFDNDPNQGAQRRHSVAGSSGAYLRSSNYGSSFNNLTSSLESLHLNEENDFGANDMEKLSNSWTEYYDQEDFQGGPGYDNSAATGGGQGGRRRVSSTGMNDLGKGLTLGQLPHHGSLFVVEFKAGRNDLFYMTGSSTNGDSNPSPPLKRGDLVIVEADRGKDLGKIANDSISPQQIQALQAQQAEIAAIAAQQDLSGMSSSGMASGAPTRTPKEIHPKRIFRLAQPSEVALLVSKNQDEMKAMVVCQSKVRQKKLPMEVVDAEYQWDRRKLTFYFIAERRIDFRELVRDLFKIYKTRIWMYAVNPLTSSGSTPNSGPSAPSSSLTPRNSSGLSGSDSSPLGLTVNCGPMRSPSPPLGMSSPGLRSPSSPRSGLSLSIIPQHHQQYQYSSSSAGLTSPRSQQHSGSNPYQQHFQQMQSPQKQQSYGSHHSGFSQPHQQQQHSHPYSQQHQQQQQQQQQQQRLSMYQQQSSPYSNIMQPLMQTQQQSSHSYPSYAHAQSP